MIVKSTRKERAVLIENFVIRRDSLLVHTCGLSVRREDLKLVQSCKFSMRTALGAVSFLLKLVVFQLESFKLIRKANKSKLSNQRILCEDLWSTFRLAWAALANRWNCRGDSSSKARSSLPGFTQIPKLELHMQHNVTHALYHTICMGTGRLGGFRHPTPFA